MSAEPVELTREGLVRLQDELEKLKAERGPLAAQIRRAAADKDVRENVPLEAAREQLGHTESRIRTIEGTLTAAVGHRLVRRRLQESAAGGAGVGPGRRQPP